MLNIKDMLLSWKLIGGFTIVVILLTIVGVVGYNGVTAVNSNLDAILGSDVVMMTNAVSMKTAVLSTADSINSYGLGEADAKQDIERAKRDFETAKETLLKMELNSEENLLIAEIDNLYSNYQKSGARFTEAIDAASYEKNANIVAARAGEHGRGFAVVADEVRKLAEESRGAANQITGLIKDIQQGTRSAVTTMEQGTKTVGDGARTISETVTAIIKIVKAAAEVATMVQEIAAAAQEQSASVEEVMASIESLSSISEESAAGTQETSAAAEEQSASMDQLVNAAVDLARLSNELQTEVGRFKIGETVSSSVSMKKNEKVNSGKIAIKTVAKKKEELFQHENIPPPEGNLKDLIK